MDERDGGSDAILLMDFAVSATVVGQNTDAFFLEIALILAAFQQIRSDVCCASTEYAGDDVGAAHPIRLVEIVAREMRRGIGMRVIEADDAQAAIAGLALNVY